MDETYVLVILERDYMADELFPVRASIYDNIKDAESALHDVYFSYADKYNTSEEDCSHFSFWNSNSVMDRRSGNTQVVGYIMPCNTHLQK